MKDIMFFIGVACWIVWLIDTCYLALKGKELLPPRIWNIVHFLAITLVTLSWYIV